LDSEPYAVRLAVAKDAAELPPIERSAGALFRTIADLAWIADDHVQSVDRHLELIAHGTAWVAVDGHDRPVAFLNAEAMGDALHIWEMSVHADHQRQGLGMTLMLAAHAFAGVRGFRALTLTTFRDVAWNDAFYRRMGFEVVAEEQLTAQLQGILQAEIDAGLPGERRCAMLLPLGGPAIAADGISG
jgi:GNAT superfamily N-acetyltransferase